MLSSRCGGSWYFASATAIARWHKALWLACQSGAGAAAASQSKAGKAIR
jgi:hypothetical protein